MNSFAHLFSANNLGSLACLAVFGLLSWYAADMRYILRAMQRKNQLAIEGRWAELEQYFEQSPNTRRPFAWFHQRYAAPGANAAGFALFLFDQGRLEEALMMADQALKQIGNKPVFLRPVFQHATHGAHCGALTARALILTEMARYDEAREAAARLGRVTGSNVRENSSLALLESKCGRFDETLALAKTVPSEDPQYESMRLVIANTYSLKGDFGQAIEALAYEPGGISAFYRPKDFENLNQSAEGSKFLELEDRKLAGVRQPVRWIMLANVYLDQEKFEDADHLLDQAEKSLGSNRVLQIACLRARARSCAGLGRSAEADDCIARIRAMMQQFRNRSTAMETHLAIGQSYLSLGRFREALAELAESQQNALHPIEKHEVAYWIARTYAVAGEPNKAIAYYQEVASSQIPSWMQRQAAAVLHKSAPANPPPPA